MANTLGGIVVRLGRVKYVPVLVLAMALMFARTLVAARLLDVEMFGKFGVGMLIANSFCMLGCFGFYSLLQRDLPMFLVKRRHLSGMVLLNQALLLGAFGFLLGLTICGLGIFSVSSTFFVVSLLNGLAQQLFLVVTLESRSQGKSSRFATENCVRGFAVIAAVSFVAWGSGSAAMTLLAETLVTLTITFGIYLQIIRSKGFGAVRMLRVSVGRLSRIKWVSPMTLLAVSVAGFVMLNGDRWIARAVLDHGVFALYTFAGVILMLGQSAQSIINVSVFPVLARTYASAGAVVAGRIAVRFSLGLLVTFCLLAIPGYFAIEYVIDFGFPDYVGAKPLLNWFIAIAVLRVSNFWTSFLVISGRETQLLILNLVALAVSLLLWVAITPLANNALTMMDIASLALLISLLNYIFTAFAVFVSFPVRAQERN